MGIPLTKKILLPKGYERFSFKAYKPFSISLSLLFDRIAFGILVLIAILPLPRLPLFFSGRGINAEARLLILLAVFLILRLIVGAKRRNRIPFLYFSYLFFFYLVFSMLFLGLSFSLVFNHLRSFFPFYVACLYLWAGTQISPHTIIISVSMALGLSAIFMFFLQFLHPQLILLIYQDQLEEWVGVLDWGRVFWLNAPLSLIFVPAFLSTQYRSPKIRIALLISVIFVLLGAVSSFNRTIILAFIAYFVVHTYMQMQKRQSKNKRKLILFLILLFIGLFFFLHINEKLWPLFSNRVLDLLAGRADLSSHWLIRKVHYVQYIEKMSDSIIFGNGLGVPLSTYPETKYWSDITFVSFMIPFGLLGLLGFSIFLAVILKILWRLRSSEFRSLGQQMIIVVIIGLFVSWNFDIWSHKTFVVFLIAIISSLDNARRVREQQLETAKKYALPISK